MMPPPVSKPFYWTEESWGPGLKCRALDAAAPHVFTTRQLQLSSRDDWQRVAEAVGASRVATLTQVHGRSVVAIRRRRPFDFASGRAEGDVLLSDDPEVGLAVRAADCVPLLIADSTRGVVAAVHAGWRGTAAGAATAAVEALAREFGSQPADLIAALGPSIGACCYEVGTDVVDAFAAAGHPRHLADRWFSSPRALSEVEEPLRRGSRERFTVRLDVAGANRDQLVLAGVREQNIHMAGLCTAMHLDVLTSYRAEKEKAGRIAGVICCRA